MLNVIDIIIQFYEALIVARVLLSWFPRWSQQPVTRWIAKLTDPVLEPLRRAVPSAGGMDFSPMIVIVVLEVIRRVVLKV